MKRICDMPEGRICNGLLVRPWNILDPHNLGVIIRLTDGWFIVRWDDGEETEYNINNQWLMVAED